MNIEYARSFQKDIKKLSPKLKSKFIDRVKIFQQDQFDPILHNHELHSPYTNCRSINISGDIRAIFIVTKNTVTFLYIGTHSELYE